MPNTTNNNWPTPADTDLVKNGADAIRDLGDAIDTTLGVYADPGLVLLNTTSFSGVSSQSVNDVFSATYQSYLVQADLINVSTANNVSIRMRVSGADNSTSNYRKQYIIAGGSTVIGSRSANQTSWNAIMIATNAYESLNVIEIHYPFETKNTEAYAKFISSPRGDIELQYMTAGFNGTTSFTGFTLIADAGTITGTVRVYGYNN